jgi:hypothetical protein
MSLMLGVNSQEVRFQQLREFEVTDRNHSWVGKGGKTYSIERSDQWEGLQHYDFASKIVDACKGFNMPVCMEKSKWGVSDEGSDLFASVSFLPSFMGKKTSLANYFTEDTMPCLGIRHSNRGRFSAQMTIGRSVLVCDNLMITGEYLFRKKHTTTNAGDIGFTIRKGLVEFISQQEKIGDTISYLKETRISNYQLGDLYLIAGRRKLLPWSHIGKVDKYWQQPTHPEFTRDGNSGWRMYNAINTVAKEYNPVRQIELISKTCDLIGEATQGDPVCY